MAHTSHTLLISTYDCGRPPFGLASLAAWLQICGLPVRCLDLAVQSLDANLVKHANLIALHLPMHTAARLAQTLLPKIRALNPHAHLLAYGLYAWLNKDCLQKLGISHILATESEAELQQIAVRVHLQQKNASQAVSSISASKSRHDSSFPIHFSAQKTFQKPPHRSFLRPLRSGLPPLKHYARLRLRHPDNNIQERLAGYTEASRGCKHLCRHCPIVPVYQGRFRAIPQDIVLADIHQQVKQGAEHITFGDADFFNGPTHAMRILRSAHKEFPKLTYDATIKVQHLLRQAALLPEIAYLGCVMVNSAVESVETLVLEKLAKNHRPHDYLHAARLCSRAALSFNPTFVAFTPWSTLRGYQRLLRMTANLSLIPQVSAVQYSIRLLIPPASLVLDLPDVDDFAQPLDAEALCHPWIHTDPRMDELQRQLMQQLEDFPDDAPREAFFTKAWQLAHQWETQPPCSPNRYVDDVPPRVTIPYLTEPWYC